MDEDSWGKEAGRNRWENGPTKWLENEKKAGSSPLTECQQTADGKACKPLPPAVCISCFRRAGYFILLKMCCIMAGSSGFIVSSRRFFTMCAVPCL